MPKVESGTKEQAGTRESAKLLVTTKEIAGELIEARDERPSALKVVFNVEDKDSTVSYAIPVGADHADEARERLKPFTNGAPTEFNEMGLRKFIAGGAKQGPFWVNTWGDYIQNFLAGPGQHIMWLKDLRAQKNLEKVWFTLENKSGETADFPAPWPEIKCQKGTTPNEDYIGPANQFNSGKGPFYYLTRMGLDWNRFALGEDSELAQAEALWPGHWDKEGFPVPSYFQSMEDLTPELLAATKRHGLKPVAVEVHIHEQYGLGVKRGDFFFEIMPVVMGDGAENAEFEREKTVFLELWDSVTKVVLADDAARFIAGGKLTADGQKVAVATIVPIIRTYPDMVLGRKSDGTPAVHFPPTPESWRLNGLAAIDFVAEKLLKADETTRFKVVDLSATDHTPFVEWAKSAVPQLADDMTTDEGDVL